MINMHMSSHVEDIFSVLIVIAYCCFNCVFPLCFFPKKIKRISIALNRENTGK